MLFLLLCLTYSIFGQNKINFGYDLAGNQTSRTICLQCKAKSSKEIKEIDSLTEDDLLKFDKEDDFSYYPNPVREELYLSWNTTSDKYISSVRVYSLAGQELSSHYGSSAISNLTLHFQNYPSGIYMVLLNYNDGGEKSIKIIKQ